MLENLEILPPALKFEKNTPTYGKLYLEPLERGYGMTLGNALRRVLLSSIRGAAITSVRFDGVLHEFSTIPGVREDVIEIMMNLKHIPVRSKSKEVRIITLDIKKDKAGVVTAADLPPDPDLEFIDGADDRGSDRHVPRDHGRSEFTGAGSASGGSVFHP